MSAVKFPASPTSEGVAMPKMKQRKHTATHSTHAPRTVAGGLLAEWKAWTPSATAANWLIFAAGILGGVAVWAFPWFLVFVCFLQAPVRGLLFVTSCVMACMLFSKAENSTGGEEDE